MKKISVLLLVLFTWIGVKAQNPVVITQPYKFQKYVNALSALYIPVYSNNTFSGYPITNGALGFALADSSTYQYFNGIWHKLGSGSSVTSVLGTTNRITSTGGTTPQIDISSTFEALLEKVANKTATASSSTTTYPNWLGVENYVASSAPVTSLTNGLTLASGVGKLGGTLTGFTQIQCGNNGLLLQGNSATVIFMVDDHHLALDAGDGTTGYAGSNFAHDTLVLFNNNGTGNKEQNISMSFANGMLVRDDLKHGLFYHAQPNYYAGRQIIDAATVDSLIIADGGGSGITALTGDVTASGPGSAAATIKTNVGLSGSPTTTTQTTSDNSTKIATTAFVQANLTATAIYFATGIFTGSGTSGSPFALGIDTSPTSGSGLPVTSGGVFTALGLKAPLASPAFTGTPTAPTATVGTNTTQVATTAFVLANAGGGLSASNFVFNEVPSGTKNGTNVTFTLANTPTTGKVSAFKNGQLLTPTTDYSMSSGTCTYVVAPLSSDTLLFNYMK